MLTLVISKSFYCSFGPSVDAQFASEAGILSANLALGWMPTSLSFRKRGREKDGTKWATGIYCWDRTQCADEI